MVHFKNDSIKGPQHLPLAKENLEVATLLEQAAAFMDNTLEEGRVHTLFYDSTYLKPYKEAYFSTVCGNLLTMGDSPNSQNTRVTSKDIRHMFATGWRDFTNHPGTHLRGLTTEQLDAAAADLMLNSTEAWNAAYDDSNRVRGMSTTMALWPSFLKFMHEQHLDKMSEEPWDPLAIDFEALAIS
jgi:hypothetical protein